MITTISRTLRASVYSAFIDGFGGPSPRDEWGLDLGDAVRYTKHGPVFRQQFERGITVANVGERSVRVELDGPYWGLDGFLRTVAYLPPHGADIFMLGAPRSGPIGRRDVPRRVRRDPPTAGQPDLRPRNHCHPPGSRRPAD